MFIRLDTIPVLDRQRQAVGQTDRQSDRRTDGFARTLYRFACIAGWRGI